MNLVITDNAYTDEHEGWSLEHCVDSSSITDNERSQIIHDLNIIGGPPLSEIIRRNPNILIFPYSSGVHHDDIEHLRICSYNTANDRLYTGNLMGFVGVNDTQLTIRSRFAAKREDYFLHYMLLKVFCPNVLKYDHHTSSESVFDFLLYMFPHFFNEALRQGLFKEYRRFQRNDLKVNGTIDVSRHIGHNIPFNGRIAYTKREYSHDNHITQLIRHTIEFIKRSPVGRVILQDRETQQHIRLITDATPSYSHAGLRKTLLGNRQTPNHPYFTKYAPLQRLCVSILKRRKLKYGGEKDKVYGLVFDGAWLWEEFLNTIFKEWGMDHPLNKTKSKPIYLFENESYPRYPDFYSENKTVIDAKYKRHADKKIARDDIHQIITYLHVLNAHAAFVAYPTVNGASQIEFIGTLKGMKGKVGQIALKIPQEANSLRHFQELMDSETATLSALWNTISAVYQSG